MISGRICLQSVISEQKVNALEASFTQAPSGENVDWRLSARISSCDVTVLGYAFVSCLFVQMHVKVSVDFVLSLTKKLCKLEDLEMLAYR